MVRLLPPPQVAGRERGQPDVHQLLGDVPAGGPGGRVARREPAGGASEPTQPTAEGRHPAGSFTLSDGSPARYSRAKC